MMTKVRSRAGMASALRRALGVGLCAAALGLFGCPDSGTTEELDTEAIRAEAEAEAEKTITEDNAESVLESLEKEIETDTEE